MLKRLKAFFLNKYDNESYLLNARAQLLVTFELVFLILVLILQLAMTLVGSEAFFRCNKQRHREHLVRDEIAVRNQQLCQQGCL